MPILVATSNQQLMFSSESWAGECGGSWPHCLKSNVTEPGLYKVSWRIQARNGRYLASAVRKISRNASANPIWASILPVPSSLLIPALVRKIAVT